MKANELRIGNWAIYADSYPVQVGSIDPGFINMDPEDTYSPIPLTPEVLEKCGFEKDEQHECYVISQDDEHELAFHYDSNVVLLSVGDNFAMQLDHIKHLHQLQNIVHALTGTELEYKP